MFLLWKDVRHAFRALRKSPGFSLVAVISLALAIGVNSTVFNLFNTVLLRDLPAPDSEQLVQLSLVADNGGVGHLTVPMFHEIERSQQVLSSMFCWWGDVVLTTEGNSGLTHGEVWAVSGDFYSQLGAVPLAGRLITPDDVHLNDFTFAPVAVIGYDFWQRNYNGDRGALGKLVHVEGVPFTIVGIMSKGFTATTIALEPDVTVPLTAEPVLSGDDRQRFGVDVAGRLKPGLTLSQARAQLEAVWFGVRTIAMPPDYSAKEREKLLSTHLEVKSIARGEDSYVRGRYAPALYLLMGLSTVILLIACINLAGLMLARSSQRSRELGVRVALGAGHWHIVSQSFIESTLLCVTGGVIGFLIAQWSSRALADFMLQNLSVREALNLSPDFRVFGFMFAVVALGGFVAGVPSAWTASHQNPFELLRRGQSIVGISVPSVGKLLVCTQVALGVLLLVGAGLFTRSLRQLRLVDPGFRTDGVLLIRLYPVPGGYKNIDNDGYYPQLVNSVYRLPGVQAVSIANLRPGGSSPWKQLVSSVLSNTAPTPTTRAGFAIVTPGFFQTLRMQLLQGRDFDWKDDDHAPRVAVLSENLARQLFPSGEYIGQRIQVGDARERQNIQVIGIVSDARLYNLREPSAPVVYVPFLQEQKYIHWTNLQVRVAGNPSSAARLVGRQIEGLGHEYALSTTTLGEVENVALVKERITAMVASTLGILALLLAAIGLYGLMAYDVLRRSREIAVRLALGAGKGAVLRMVVREALGLVLVGIAFGVPAALATTRVIANLLFATSPTDGLTFLLAPAVLLLSAGLASYLPARRAMQVDPAMLLRLE